MHTILDNVYDDKNNPLETAENLRFILGSFDFEPLADGKKQLKGVNIAHIPISLDYFGKWFTDQVISQGETRKSFPILYFIRNLCNNLLQESMLEGCVNRNVEKKLRFMTSQITAWKGGAGKPDPISSLPKQTGPIDVSINRGRDNTFPLKGDSTSGEITNRANKISGFQNYLLVCTQGTSLTHTLRIFVGPRPCQQRKAGRGRAGQELEIS